MLNHSRVALSRSGDFNIRERYKCEMTLLLFRGDGDVGAPSERAQKANKKPRHGYPISDPFRFCSVFIFFLRQHHVACLERPRCAIASCSVENTPSIYGRVHLH